MPVASLSQLLNAIYIFCHFLEPRASYKFCQALSARTRSARAFNSETLYGARVNPGDDASHDVVPSLIDLLAEAMGEVEERRGGAKAAERAVADHLDVGPWQIRRYLKKRNSTPPASELDALVTAVAVEAGKQRLELWRQALDGVEERVDARKGDPRQEAAEAASRVPLESPESDETR